MPRSTNVPGRMPAAAGLIAVVAILLIPARAPAAQSTDPGDGIPAQGVIEDRYGNVGRMKLGEPAPAAKGYSPYAGRKYPMRPLFGDTHLHSTNSGDAFGAGNRFTPEQTYRIARGEVRRYHVEWGHRSRLRRPGPDGVRRLGPAGPGRLPGLRLADGSSARLRPEPRRRSGSPPRCRLRQPGRSRTGARAW